MSEGETSNFSVTLKQLHYKRGAIKRKVTDCKSFVSELINKHEFEDTFSRTEILNLQFRIDNLLQGYNQVQELQFEILEVTNDQEYEEQYMSDFDKEYYSVLSEARRIVEANSVNGSVVEGTSNCLNRSNSSSNVRLPTISLPKFKGDFSTWLEFHDTFNSLIQNNDSLTPVQKFHYLKASLQDEAADVIKALTLTDSNYVIAWDLLCQRYSNKKRLVQNHIRELFSQKVIQKESAANIREVVDNSLKHLRSLQCLGQSIDNWDPIIVYLLSSKLDKGTLRDWESHKIEGELPTVDELVAFLRSRADVLDNLVQGSWHQGISGYKPTNVKVSKTFVTGAPAPNKTLSCNVCDGSDHGIYHCSKFLELPVEKRIEQVKRLNLCYNCLRNNHHSNTCNAKTCNKCEKKHNTLLHKEQVEPESVDVVPSTSFSETFSSHNSSSDTHVLLATAIVNIQDKRGKLHSCRALLDSASQSHFLTSEMAKLLQVEVQPINMKVSGINQVFSTIKAQCKVNITSQVTKYSANISCLIVDKISGNIPNQVIVKEDVNIPKNLKLADRTFNEPGRIDLLIGAQLFWQLLIDGKVSVGNSFLTLQNTQLGWILSGTVPDESGSKSKVTQCYFIGDIADQLKQFWEIEECPSKRAWTSEEKACEEHFIENVSRTESGRFVVSIPFQSSPDQLGESKDIALKRLFSLEKKLATDNVLQTAYVDFMSHYQGLGHMSMVSDSNDTDSAHYYLPHHGVKNESSRSTKLRVVFNASNPTSNGISLNDLQMTGPNVQAELIEILLRFRTKRVAFSMDIEKMYRQILIVSEQRKFQRIFWRPSDTEKVKTFELNTVTYGTRSAPFLATRCLQQLAEEYSDKYPEASLIIKQDCYMDDILSTTDSVEEAVLRCNQVRCILEAGQFPLHKWVCNEPCMLEIIDVSYDSNSDVCVDSTNATKTLGLHWCSSRDTLQYKISNHKDEPILTKRYILSEVSKLFDPLGLLGPITILGKVILQLIWQEGTQWDEEVSEVVQTWWNRLKNEWSSIECIQIPRNVLCQVVRSIELHGFSDASDVAYGACIYYRSTSEVGHVTVNLLCAKSRVAPIKKLTIPRLELCGAHLLAKLLRLVSSSIQLSINQVYLWTDSTIVLGWLRLPPSSLKVFVSHRVSFIKETVKNAIWLHTPSQSNPADLLSRGVLPSELKNSRLWWNGPDWLQQDQTHWPPQSFNKQVELPETKHVNSCLVVTQLKEVINWHHFSIYNRLIRSTAYVFRFIRNSRNQSNTSSNYLTIEELERALSYIIRVVQQECFQEEIALLRLQSGLPLKSKLLSLAPILDEQEILRVGGRLQASRLEYGRKHPILLPKTHPFTKLLFQHEHNRLGHAGAQQMVASIRETYWPMGARATARKTVHECIRCFRCKPKTTIPLMGNLPPDRVIPIFPFHTVGVDYAGPLLIKDKPGRGARSRKCYIALFVCFTTKAVHLELVSDLTTEAFLACLRRFVSRRGKPSKIFSDNASNFASASKELKSVLAQLVSDNDVIATDLSSQGITWSNIPPKSPNFGGLWEAGVKGVKFHLKRIMGNALFTFEQLYTVLTQIEAIMNSRPLTEMSSDPSDLSCLTPAHFLIGRPSTAVPEVSVINISSNRLSYFQRVQQVIQHFWIRWQAEYLQTLQQRKRWMRNSNNVQVGQMVLLHSEGVPPIRWNIGRITKTFPGKDNIVRVAEVRTNTGVYRRSVTKVFPLPVVN